MNTQQFRKEIEQQFPSVEFHYQEFTAQTYPADNANIAIVYDSQIEDCPWLFSGKNACHGYGKTLEAAIADSALRYQAWLNKLGNAPAPTVAV